MSYFNLLGIEKEPFSTSPDPSFFYGSIHHRQALANLLIDLRLRRGLSVVIGDIGTGKTTLGRKLIQLLKQRPNFIFHIVCRPHDNLLSFLFFLFHFFSSFHFLYHRSFLIVFVYFICLLVTLYVIKIFVYDIIIDYYSDVTISSQTYIESNINLQSYSLN